MYLLGPGAAPRRARRRLTRRRRGGKGNGCIRGCLEEGDLAIVRELRDSVSWPSVASVGGAMGSAVRACWAAVAEMRLKGGALQPIGHVVDMCRVTHRMQVPSRKKKQTSHAKKLEMEPPPAAACSSGTKSQLRVGPGHDVCVCGGRAPLEQ